MEATSTLVSFGRRWFQLRGVSPVPVILVAVLWPSATIPSGGELFILGVLVLLGEGIRVWAVGYAGSVTRTRNDEAASLVHAGPFRYVRNPLYIANVLIYVSWALAFGMGWFAAGVFLYFAVQYALIVQYEENLLRRQFGADYVTYCEKVSRWFPSLTPVIPTSGHEFELRKSLRSERSTLIAIGAMTTLLAIKLYLS